MTNTNYQFDYWCITTLNDLNIGVVRPQMGMTMPKNFTCSQLDMGLSICRADYNYF